MESSELRAWAEERLADDNPDAVFFDGLDDAIIGVGNQYTKPTLVIYDWDKIVAGFVADGMDYDTAVEYVDFNVTDLWAGDGTPIIVHGP